MHKHPHPHPHPLKVSALYEDQGPADAFGDLMSRLYDAVTTDTSRPVRYVVRLEDVDGTHLAYSEGTVTFEDEGP